MTEVDKLMMLTAILAANLTKRQRQEAMAVWKKAVAAKEAEGTK